MEPMNVLVTGAAGYTGSHAAHRLLTDGHTVVGVDNLLRGNQAAIHALKSTPNGPKLTFIPADIADRGTIETALRDHKIDAVMHFAALAAVEDANRKIWLLTLDWDARWLDTSKNPNQMSAKLRDEDSGYAASAPCADHQAYALNRPECTKRADQIAGRRHHPARPADI